MLTKNFISAFKEEHREIRNSLIGVMLAFKDRDKVRIGYLLKKLEGILGFHFRYEEESLYPELQKIFHEQFTKNYIEKLLNDHDTAIRYIRDIIAISGEDNMSTREESNVLCMLHEIMASVSDCDGLSILIGMIPEQTLKLIIEARDHSLKNGLMLFDWAKYERKSPVVLLK